MKALNLKISFLSIVCFAVCTISSFAQQGQVTINHDKKIDNLLEIKKEMNKNDNDSDRYKIQVYSGNRSGAQNAQTDFSNSFGDWRPVMQYETPNFKIWVGNFRTRLEADRALERIKKKFPSAFIFKPKK
ncbi:SPOR domain-containing protein [Sabulilitoribacter multivorans]|uniref:SPOR domain-containing protein n=1 Tax=Flaviramulus multivorans TaxID=1304750 RepID=A0ABS9IFH0_9FLAO|nr:SPOR domain-containing protein [Flaviramulus multivorans]MCF7559278.1 SPOR domain-containing protein [Flaviramulus multivorans]